MTPTHSLCIVSLLIVVACAYYEHNTWTYQSTNGIFNFTIVDNVSVVVLGGKKVQTRCWNGKYNAPALRVNPGDHFHLVFQNVLNESTNVHFHGFQVAPTEQHGDNVFISIDGKTNYFYDFPIPSDHPVGLYWYHAHLHSVTEEQVQGGMSGMILVGDVLASFPQMKGVREVIWQLKDMQLVGPDSNGVYHPAPSPIDETKDTIRSVNGEVHPVFRIEQNEVQFWAFVNMGPNIYYELNFSGFVLSEIVRDGHVLTKLVNWSSYHLGPGSRAGFLVVGPPAGTYQFSTEPFTTGPSGGNFPHVDLAKIVSATSNRPPPSLPTVGFPILKDLRNSPIAQERTIVFRDDGGSEFYINGQVFDPTRIDFEVKLGDIEEWTIINSSDDDHVFSHSSNFIPSDKCEWSGYGFRGLSRHCAI